MSETNYQMELVLETGMHIFTFATLAGALVQLDLIEPKIGHKFSNDPDQRRHRITADDGAMVVDMSAVKAARVLDCEAFRALTADNRRVDNEERSRASREQADYLAQALAAALKNNSVAAPPSI